MRTRRAHLVAMAAIPALLFAGCGDDGDDDNSSKETSSAATDAGADDDGQNPFAGESPAEVLRAAAEETQKLESLRMQIDNPASSLKTDLR